MFVLVKEKQEEDVMSKRKVLLLFMIKILNQTNVHQSLLKPLETSLVLSSVTSLVLIFYNSPLEDILEDLSSGLSQPSKNLMEFLEPEQKIQNKNSDIVHLILLSQTQILVELLIPKKFNQHFTQYTEPEVIDIPKRKIH